MGTNTTFSCPNDSRLLLGGEYSGAMVYIAESSPDKSVVYSVVVLKLEHSQVTFFASVIVTILTLLLTDEQMLSWGWRIPFLIACTNWFGRFILTPSSR